MENIIDVLDKDGQQKQYRVISTYHSNESEKDYIIYTDDTYTDNQLNIIASEYNPNENNTFLRKITNEKDLKTIESILEKLDMGEK